jgi:hypothetical protein
MDKNFEKLIEKLVKNLPNDMELGREIRKVYVKKITEKEPETIKSTSNGVQ